MSDRRNHMTGDAWGNDIHSNAERAALPPKATPNDIARAIDQARREGYAAGVRAAERISREAFVEWLRPWAKAKFGKWITHNTAIGARNEFGAAIRALDGKGGGV